jgi:hypothetical protein
MTSSNTTPAPKPPDFTAVDRSSERSRNVIVTRRADLHHDPLNADGVVPHRTPQLVGDSVTENSLVHTTSTAPSSSERQQDRAQRKAESLDTVGDAPACRCPTCGPGNVLPNDHVRQAVAYVLGQD